MMQPYYSDESCVIYHGDCREIIPTLEPVDLVLTDPPYNVSVNYGGNHNDSMDLGEFTSWVKQWFCQCRVMSKTMLITGQVRLPQYAVIEPWKWLLAWFKPAAMGRSPVGFCAFEPIALWGDGSKAGMTDVILAPIKAKKFYGGGHPCPKPIEWAKGQIVRFPDSKTILDPFCGSGTTLKASKENGIKSIGIEIEERYCEIAANRLRQKVLF